jgi:hypothetical protein
MKAFSNQTKSEYNIMRLQRLIDTMQQLGLKMSERDRLRLEIRKTLCRKLDIKH